MARWVKQNQLPSCWVCLLSWRKKRGINIAILGVMNFEVVTFSSKLQVPIALFFLKIGLSIYGSFIWPWWEIWDSDWYSSCDFSFFGEISSFEQNTCSLLCNPSTQKFDSATDKLSFFHRKGIIPNGNEFRRTMRQVWNRAIKDALPLLFQELHVFQELQGTWNLFRNSFQDFVATNELSYIRYMEFVSKFVIFFS